MKLGRVIKRIFEFCILFGFLLVFSCFFLKLLKTNIESKDCVGILLSVFFIIVFCGGWLAYSIYMFFFCCDNADYEYEYEIFQNNSLRHF